MTETGFAFSMILMGSLNNPAAVSSAWPLNTRIQRVSNPSTGEEERSERELLTKGLDKLDATFHRKRRANNISAGLARLDLELQAIKPIWRPELRRRRAA